MSSDRKLAFPITQSWVYLNHALISPLPAASTLAASKRMHSLSRSGLGSYKAIRRGGSLLLQQLSDFFNCAKERVILFGNISEAILFLRHRLPVDSGQRIVGVGIPEAHQPAWNLWRGRNVDETFDEGIAPDAGNTALVALNPLTASGAEFHSLDKYADFCRDSNSIFLVDLSFATGINPVSMADLGIDILLTETHRWMLGTPDLVVMCVSDDVAKLLRMSRKSSILDSLVAPSGPLEQTPFMSLPTLFDQSGSFASQAALAKSMDIVNEMGFEYIQNHISSLKTQIANGLREEGFEIAPQHNTAFLSGIVSAKHGQLPSHQLAEALLAHRVQVGWHDEHLWVSPHFYNNEDDLQKFLDAVRSVIAART